jgi:hypothetical protein
MVYENKRLDNYVEEYQKKIGSNSSMQDKCKLIEMILVDRLIILGEREILNFKQKMESTKNYVQDVSSRNSRIQEDIEKKTFEIDQTRQDHHMLFKVALETIMRRLKEYEAECEKKGLHIEKYGHLDKVVEEEQTRIL